MNELLGRKEIQRFMEEVVNCDIEETFDTWGINQEEVAQWIQEMAHSAVVDMLITRNPRLTLQSSFLIGIEVGYKLCLENETRRIAHE